MDQLPIAVCLLPAGPIETPVIAHFRAAAVRNFSLATSSPAGELVAPTHKTMSQSDWYQNRGPATTARTFPHLVFILVVELASIIFPTGP